MERNGWKYINMLEELYTIPEAKLTKLRENADKLSKALEPWSWPDIERQISCFYAYKSDKSYPKVAQIIALLRADKESKAVNPEEFIGLELKEPTTNIQIIKAVYPRAVYWMHVNGVCQNEYLTKVKKIPYGNGSVLKEHVLPGGRRDYKLWFKRWDVEDAIVAAKKTDPDMFAQFPDLTKAEELAFAIKMGFFAAE